MDPQTDLLTTIEGFLACAEMTATEFGRKAMGDPLFVFELRKGREPRRATRDRALAYIREHGAPAPVPTEAAA